MCAMIMNTARFLALSLFGQAVAIPREHLSKKSVAEIVERYQFVGDFRFKKRDYKVSSELFWPYPLALPRPIFNFDHSLGDLSEELPLTLGEGPAVHHMNYGRVLFRQGKYDEARQVWLGGRRRYGTTFPFHRRNDYFIGLAFLKISEGINAMFDGNTSKKEVRLTYSNAATFFSWAFIKKAKIPDPALSKIAPKVLYNLAVIYFLFNRYTTAHSTAVEGLNFLRANGQSAHRGELRRILGETFLRDRQYLRAVQEFDVIIRQEKDYHLIAAAFARVADIYFDLANYEMAEDIYSLSQAVYQESGYFDPQVFLFRGEALFWLGRFTEAKEQLNLAIISNNYQRSRRKLKSFLQSWGKLRYADTFLARYRLAEEKQQKDLAKKFRDKAELAYYQVKRLYPNSEAAEVADVRRACFNLPIYKGNNIKHARETLEGANMLNIPQEARELAWSCAIMSYEEDGLFLSKVKDFYASYPNSFFLKQFVGPLKKIQAKQLDKYLLERDYHRALTFLDHYRGKLFTDLSPDQEKMLFQAYMDTGQPSKAKEYWENYKSLEPESLGKDIRVRLFHAETGRRYKGDVKVFAHTAENVAFIQRIMRSSRYREHNAWIYATVKDWAKEKDYVISCEWLQPVLSHRYEFGGHEKLWKDLSEHIAELFPEMFSRSQLCSQAFLDLEARLGNTPPRRAEYLSRWISRLQWSYKRITVPLMFQAAHGHLDDPNGRRILEFVSKLEQAEHPQVHFARSLLAEGRTETERMWE